MLPFGALPALRLAAGSRDEVDRRGDGGRRRLPGRLRQGPGRGRRRAAPERRAVFISVTDGDKPAATQLAASFHDMGFRVLATGGTAQAIRRMGVPVERIRKLVRGLAQRGRADRGGRGGPGDQHARPARAPAPTDTRSAGPPSGTGHPLHHDDVGRERRRSGRSGRGRSGETERDLPPGAPRDPSPGRTFPGAVFTEGAGCASPEAGGPCTPAPKTPANPDNTLKLPEPT